MTCYFITLYLCFYTYFSRPFRWPVCQDEIAELKRKLKFKSLEIEQLKEEISGKEATMSREHQDALRVERDNEGLKVGPATMTGPDPLTGADSLTGTDS